MKKNLVLTGLGVLAGLAGLVAVMLIVSAQPYTLHGSVIAPAIPAPALALPSTDGKTFELSQQQGKFVLVFFGYTSCTDVCPATLALLRQVISQLAPQERIVRVVFVTVDPQRDTMEKMQNYVSAFGPEFTGLTGTPDLLDPVWKAYGVFHEIQPNSRNPDAYMVDHSTFIYLIDQKGQLRLTYPLGTNVDDMVKDIQYLLKEG